MYPRMCEQRRSYSSSAEDEGVAEGSADRLPVATHDGSGPGQDHQVTASGATSLPRRQVVVQVLGSAIGTKPWEEGATRAFHQ